MAGKLMSRILWVLVMSAALFLGWRVYEKKMRSALPPGIASGNGRIEAIQVDVSAKEPGRIAKILAHEGDLVEPDQVVARMDIATLEAELARGNANVATAQEKATVVKSSIVRRVSWGSNSVSLGVKLGSWFLGQDRIGQETRKQV